MPRHLERLSVAIVRDQLAARRQQRRNRLRMTAQSGRAVEIASIRLDRQILQRLGQHDRVMLRNLCHERHRSPAFFSTFQIRGGIRRRRALLRLIERFGHDLHVAFVGNQVQFLPFHLQFPAQVRDGR